MAFPGLIVSGQVIASAHINAIRTSVMLWPGNVDADGYTLDDLGSLVFRANGGFGAGSAGTPSVRFSGDGNTGLYQPAGDSVSISTGGAERVRVNNNGLGVGTAAGTDMHVDVLTTGPYAQLRLQSSGGNADTGIILKDTSQEWKVGINVGVAGVGRYTIYNITAGRTMFTINDTGFQMYIGGALRTISVDGSGFVKAT